MSLPAKPLDYDRVRFRQRNGPTKRSYVAIAVGVVLIAGAIFLLSDQKPLSRRVASSLAVALATQLGTFFVFLSQSQTYQIRSDRLLISRPLGRKSYDLSQLSRVSVDRSPKHHYLAELILAFGPRDVLAIPTNSPDDFLEALRPHPAVPEASNAPIAPSESLPKEFEETSRPPLAPAFLKILCALSAAAWLIGYLGSGSAGEDDPFERKPLWILFGLTAVMFTVLLFGWLRRVRVVVDPTGIHIRAAPFHHRHIPLSRIVLAEPTDPFYAIHVRPPLRIGPNYFATESDTLIRVVIRNNFPVFIGTYRPEELTAAINGFVAARKPEPLQSGRK